MISLSNRYFKNCCPGSSWNSETQQCEGCIRIVTVVCPLPPDIPNAEVTVENNTARYFCNPGYYQLENTDEFISCDGNIWQPTNFECIQCMSGFTGVNCSSLCPYPYYGEDCQRTCNCSRDLCNVSTGCIRIVTVVCPLPPDIPNADVTVKNNTARYFCNPGYYQLENADDFISCDGNIWQPTNFECIRPMDYAGVVQDGTHSRDASIQPPGNPLSQSSGLDTARN
uniref:Sushi domain-containing protein n=1 Tax=Magallana gigas TaxID=29159 RepID=A0A8W8JGW9_MAGGI